MRRRVMKAENQQQNKDKYLYSLLLLVCLFLFSYFFLCCIANNSMARHLLVKMDKKMQEKTKQTKTVICKSIDLEEKIMNQIVLFKK